MADDLTTRLIVDGGREFVSQLTEAAVAQQNLINVISRASQQPPSQLGAAMQTAAEGITKAEKVTQEFSEAAKILGVDLDDVIRIVQRQNKALLENAAAAEKATAHQKALAQASQTVGANARTAPLIGDLTRNQQINAREDQLFRQAIPGPQRNFQNVRSTTADRAIQTFIENEANVRNRVEERALLASQEREKRRTAILRQEFEARVRLHSQEAQDRLNQERRRARGEQFTGFDNARFSGGFAGNLDNITASTQRVTKASQDKNRAIDEQTQAESRSSRGGITYLSTLSAIHAASFLATNRTFTLVGSLTTLGFAFSRLGVGAQLIGVTFGGALLAFNAVTTSIDRLQQAFFKVITTAGAVGAAITLAFAGATAESVKLAGGVEDAFSEVVAFGGPTVAQLGEIDEIISGLSRRFGETAKDVTQSSSAFIRAGGSIEQAIKGASEAVVLLQVASRGELVPANAARSIAVVTNAFKDQGVEAGRAADIIVGTAQKSALTFTEVTQAFQQAAPTAANLNIPLTDLAATIAVLANNGLRGQVAGSGFKQVLLDLLNPSKQARERLQELNISLFDTEGKVRPLGDVFADLQAKLGPLAAATSGLTDAQRGQALAAIFGSRANLAAAIIARTGKQDFDEMREAIEATSAIDIANTLLAPTNAQVRILTTNVQELARAFGGPLNVAIGTVIKSVNEFLQSVGRGGFERAGQAIIAVITGQGFGPISQALDNLSETNPRVSSFFTNLLNSALTVRNAVVSQFIPAIENAGGVLETAFSSLNIEQEFNSITKALLNVVSAGSQFTTFMAQLVSDIVTGSERGNKLRETLAGLTTIIGTTLVGALAAVVIPMAATVKLLEHIGKAVIDVLDDMGKFNTLWEVGWEIAKNSVNNFLKDVSPRLQALGQLLVGIATRDMSAINEAMARLEQNEIKIQTADAVRNFGTLDNALINTSAQLGRVRQKIKENEDAIARLEQVGADVGATGDLGAGIIAQENNALREQERLLAGITETLRNAKQAGATGESGVDALFGAGVIPGLREFRDKIEEIRRNPANLSDILNFAEGDLPDFFTNLAKQVAQVEDLFNKTPEDDPTLSGFLPDPDEAAKIARQLNDIFRDANRDIDNLTEDAHQKHADLIQDTLRKIIDAQTNFNKQMTQINQDVIDRKDEALESLQETRADRGFNQAIQIFFENAERQHDAFNQRRDLREQQSLSEFERANQRRLQDVQTFFSRRESLDQQAFSRQQALEDRAFQRGQQDDQRTLSQRQRNEENALNKSLESESRKRDIARRLAEAAPSERAKIQEDINREEQDRKFQEGQQNQLKALRERHERENVTFARQQEDQAFQFRIQQQLAEFAFRIRLEEAFQRIRRGLEDQEQGRIDNRDSALLERRISRAEFEALRRRSIQQGQQTLADQYEDNVLLPRRFGRIDREAAKRRITLGTNTIEQLFDIIDRFEEQKQTQSEQRARQARGITQRATERATQFAEGLGQRPGGLETMLDRINFRLFATLDLLEKGQAESIEFLNLIHGGTLGDIANLAPGARTIRPPQGPQLPTSLNTNQPVTLSVPAGNTIRLLIPNDFGTVLGQGVAAGLQQAGALAPRSSPQINIGGNVYDPTDLLRLYQQYLYGSAVQRR
jgi:TP901 family phage tail tape measure protein